nr:cell wall protein RTB1-like [Aegilops tauschii subsp. strangulata]
MTTDELVTMQAKIKGLSDEFDAYHADWLGAKVRFVKMAKGFTSNVAAPTQHESPEAYASAEPTKEHASTADENQAAEENESTRADEDILAAEETARATTSVAPEEQSKPAEASADAPEDTKQARATASVAPEETAPISSAPPAPTPSPILPSASEAKKTKAAERAAMKKRKASASSESSAPKKAKTLTSSYDNPIDVVPVSSMPSKEIVTFAEEAGIEEIDEEDEDVDIGCSTPILNDDYREKMETHAATDDIATEIPQPAAPETVVPEAVKTLTDTPQPKPKKTFSKKQKFKAAKFFNEHNFFTNYNPYDSARLRRKRF